MKQLRPSIVDELRLLPQTQSLELLLSHLPGWVAELAPATKIPIVPQTSFGEINEAWRDVERLSDVLLPHIYKRLGLWLMPEEVAGRERLHDLACYIVSELHPPAPEAGFADPYADGAWAFSTPSPYPYPARATQTAVFLLGPPRSGTTLLRAMMTGHPRLFAPPELNLLPFDTLADRRREFVGAGVDPTHAGLIQAFMHLGRWTYEDANARVADLEVRGEAMADVYQHMQHLAGGRLIVDKSPLYQAHPGWLQRAEQMFSAPRYLFLIRHPFPVIESMVRHRFHRWLKNGFGVGDSNPWLFAEKLWTVYTQNALRFLATVPSERQCWLRYEELVTEPQAAMGKLCRFLQMEFDAALLDPYSGERMLDGVGDPSLKQRSGIDAGLSVLREQHRPPQPLHSLTVQTAQQLGYDIQRL